MGVLENINQIFNFLGIDFYTMALNAWVKAAFSIWNNALDRIVPVISKMPSEWSQTTVLASGETVPGAYSAVLGIASKLVGFSEGLLVLVFCIGIFGSTASLTEHKNWSSILRLFMRFILAKTGIECIANSPLGSTGNSILQTIDKIVYGIKDIIISATGDPASTVDKLKISADMPQELMDEYFGDVNMWQMVGYMALLLILIGIMGLMAIRLFIIVYGRFFKIYILTAISPIPMAFFGSQTTQKIGIGFLKSYVIALAEVIVIILALIVYGFLITTINPETSDSLIMYFFNIALSTILLVTCIQGAEKMLRDIANG